MPEVTKYQFMGKEKIIVIAGATASGKTSIAIRLARKINAEIISADSIQLFRYMDIGSAKPTIEERSRVPHHLIDIRYPDEPFSAGDFLFEARKAITNIVSRRRVPLVVGGTGLYIKLLLGGLAQVPPSDPKLRLRIQEREKQIGPGTLYEELIRIDADIAGLTTAENVNRISRYLEIYEVTGRKPSELLKEHQFADRPYDYLFLCLDEERASLYERIDVRVDNMIKGGLLEETAYLLHLGYSRDLKPMKSLGYRHAGMILAGEMRMSEAVELMKRDTRRYAKRQFTWFRSEPKATWIDHDKAHGLELMVINFLES